jgi:hypothetical protein
VSLCFTKHQAMKPYCGVVIQSHALPPGKEFPVPIGQEARRAPEPVWKRWRREKFPAPTGNRTPDRPAHKPVAIPTELHQPSFPCVSCYTHFYSVTFIKPCPVFASICPQIFITSIVPIYLHIFFQIPSFPSGGSVPMVSNHSFGNG